MQSLQGFLGDLARSLGGNATLLDILQTLDEHYGMAMTFDALSKELYSLKQGSGENMAKIWGAIVIAGPDTPIRVFREYPTGAHEGSEEGSLL